MSPDPRALRIVSVLTTHAAGGAEYAAVDMLAALAREGADVTLLTNRPELTDGTDVIAVPVDLGPKLRRHTAVEVALRSPLLARRLVHALRPFAYERPIDIVLLHYKKEQLLGVVVPRSVARSVVWAEWGPLPVAMRGRLPSAAYALASRSADAIVAESEGTAASLRAAGVPAAKVVVVPNVLGDDGLTFDAEARTRMRAAWGLDQDRFVLGCISRLDVEKRVDVAIDALQFLDEDVTLVIAGSGEGEAALRARATSYGERVRFVGEARGRVAAILSACDLQVYAPGPSEGAARAVTFGQLTSRPVIATAPEGARGLVTPGTGTVVTPPNDPRALAAVIAEYAADRDRVAAEGIAGRAAATCRIVQADALATLQSTLRSAARLL
jgi:glycosyltransferase involved in cell wall biosynthesis